MRDNDSAIAALTPALPRLPEGAGATTAPLRRAHVRALVLAGAFLVYASANAVVPVASELRAAVGLGGSGAAIFLQPFAVGFGLGSVVWLLGARAGAARVVLPLSLVLGAAAGVLLTVAAVPEAAVVARVLAGAAAAGYPAAAQALIADTVAADRRARGLGGFIACVVAGSFAGQAIAGAVADAASARVAIALVCVAAPAACAWPWRARCHPPPLRRARNASRRPGSPASWAASGRCWSSRS